MISFQFAMFDWLIEQKKIKSREVYQIKDIIVFLVFTWFRVYINLLVGRHRKYLVADEGSTYSVIYTRSCIKRVCKVSVSSHTIDRPFERAIQWPLRIPRVLSRANSHFSRALFFVVAFCMRNSVSFSYSSITESRSKETRLHRVSASAQFFPRRNAVTRTMRSDIICGIPAILFHF